MTTERFSVTIGILLFANVGWGFSPQRVMESMQKRAQHGVSQASDTERTRSTATCVDFSGHWKGQCLITDTNGTNLYEDEIKMVQESCDFLYYLDDFSARNLQGSTKIGETSSKDASSFDAVIFSEWVQGGNLLRGYMSMAVGASFSTNFLYLTAAGTLDYSIVNNKLIVTQEDTSYNNFMGASSSNEVCEYDLIAPMTMP